MYIETVEGTFCVVEQAAIDAPLQILLVLSVPSDRLGTCRPDNVQGQI